MKRIGTRLRWLAGLAVVLWAQPAFPQASLSVTAVRTWTAGGVTRVAIEVSGDFSYRTDKISNPDRVFFDIAGARLRLSGQQRGVTTIAVGSTLLKQIRVAQTRPDVARIVLDLAAPADHSVTQLANPSRLVVEVRPAADRPVFLPAPPSAASTAAPPPEAAPVPLKTAERPVVEPAGASLAGPGTPPPKPLAPPHGSTPPSPALSAAPSVKAAVEPKSPARPAAVAAEPPPVPAARNSDGSRSLTRALGLKISRVVIDPGHGGHDHGTTGPGGLTEKDLVLDVATRLGQLIESRLACEVIYTRKDDTFIPLEERTAIANRSHADLFLSIHANSSPYPNAAGVESYYLNFTNSKVELEVAARENAGHHKSVYELSDLLEKIAKQDKRDESREFAARVQKALYPVSARANDSAKNRGVKSAPFVVLIGASMPSVLTEIGFVTNRREEARLKSPEYRQKVAEALFKGLKSYASTLSHYSVAQRQEQGPPPE